MLLDAIMKAFEKSLDFSGKVIDRLDEKKFSEAVVEYYGKEPGYEEWDAMTKTILADSTIDSAKKIELIRLVSDEKEKVKKRELEGKEKAVQVIEEDHKKKGQVMVDIAMGVLTGGVSAVVKAISSVKGKSQGESDLPGEEGKRRGIFRH